jgi:hypothetical protein
MDRKPPSIVVTPLPSILRKCWVCNSPEGVRKTGNGLLCWVCLRLKSTVDADAAEYRKAYADLDL